MALTMRGRYLMREYWSDSDLFLKLSAEEREFYVGLWTLADDEGWMPRDIPEIAGHLLRFEDRGPREEKTRLVLRRLTDIGKLRSLRCGCIYLAAVAKYPRAGKRSSEHAQAHRAHSNGFEPVRTDLNTGSTGNQTDLNASPDVVRPHLTKSDGGRASANGSKEPGLKDRLGDFADVVKGIA